MRKEHEPDTNEKASQEFTFWAEDAARQGPIVVLSSLGTIVPRDVINYLCRHLLDT